MCCTQTKEDVNHGDHSFEISDVKFGVELKQQLWEEIQIMKPRGKGGWRKETEIERGEVRTREARVRLERGERVREERVQERRTRERERESQQMQCQSDFLKSILQVITFQFCLLVRFKPLHSKPRIFHFLTIFSQDYFYFRLRHQRPVLWSFTIWSCGCLSFPFIPRFGIALAAKQFWLIEAFIRKV